MGGMGRFLPPRQADVAIAGFRLTRLPVSIRKTGGCWQHKNRLDMAGCCGELLSLVQLPTNKGAKMTHDKHAVNIVSLEGWARPSLAVAARLPEPRVCEEMSPSVCAWRANSVRPPALASGLFMGPVDWK